VLGPGPKTVTSNAVGQRPSHLMLSGRNLAALRTGAGKMDDFEVWFAELNELPEINNIIQYPSGHIRRISTKFS
jgi:hypothetical protein